MCGVRYQACLDALYDGHKAWARGRDEQRIAIGSGTVQSQRDRGDSRVVPKPVPKTRLRPQNDAGYVAPVRLYERKLIRLAWTKKRSLRQIPRFKAKRPQLSLGSLC
jgi:hypothetical protein